MCWSKNVFEERDAADQIILAANDPSFCTHLALAIHLEYAIANGTVNPIDENDKLLGTLSDGDIRRGLLKGLNVNSSIKSIILNWDTLRVEI